MALVRDFVRFIFDTVPLIFKGNLLYWVWLLGLGAIFGVGVVAYFYQLFEGLVVTNMNDQIVWGAYIANFSFVVGLIDAAVLVMIPAYLYAVEEMKKVLILSLHLAMAAAVMALMFVLVDIGRPDKAWHMAPGLGWLRFPGSMLAWDTMVLNGWLTINALLVTAYVFMVWRGQTPDPRRWFRIMLFSIVFAVGLHVVTAFLYSWIGARPYWNSAVLAPRFIASAFVAGPAFFVLALLAIRHYARWDVPDSVITMLRRILAVTMTINLFLFGSEFFTEMASTGTHRVHAVYLYFGLHGHDLLVPFIWSAIAMNLVGWVIFLTPSLARRPSVLSLGCILSIVGIWTEKGMGIVVPGFVPGPLGEMTEYIPSAIETVVCAGIWALGGLILTVLVRMTYPVVQGDVVKGSAPAERRVPDGAALGPTPAGAGS